MLELTGHMNIEERRGFHGDFEKALAFAARLHAEQLRKGTEIPYISHLIAVAGIVLDNGGGRDEAIAALLHDAIEDQSATHPEGASGLRQEIRSQFGERVLEIVESCTDAETTPKPPWTERKQAYITHIEQASDAARLVSCADKLHNARAIVSDLRVLGNGLWSRFAGGKEGSLWYYRKLADVFLRLGPRELSDELDRTVVEMFRLANVPDPVSRK
jgi:(p)ppGpp synthase/HD superfamily hydrolase